MQVTVTEKGSYKRLLNIEVETAKLDEKFENVLKTYKKDLSLPGFRPGKVPRDMIVKRFGTALRQEAVEQAVGDSFKEACEKEKIVPIAKPTVNLIENKAGAVPDEDGSAELNTLTSLGMPGPEPTMMLSALDPSICVAVTLTPPCASGANAKNRVSSVANAGVPPPALPE